MKTTRLRFLSFSTGTYQHSARLLEREDHIQGRSLPQSRGQPICVSNLLPYTVISKLCLLAGVYRERLEVCSNLIMYSTQQKSMEN